MLLNVSHKVNKAALNVQVSISTASIVLPRMFIYDPLAGSTSAVISEVHIVGDPVEFK